MKDSHPSGLTPEDLSNFRSALQEQRWLKQDTIDRLGPVLAERDSREFVLIDEALERIEEGTYGICEDCGRPIGMKRLSARPLATRCLECQARQEAA